MTFQPSQRRRNFLFGAVGVMGASIGSLAGYADAQSQPRLVKVTAERFHFTPNRIQLKKGEAVVLELTTLDVPMGFNAPAFKVRANILPDAPAQVPLTPQQAGEFEFFCDIVCGSGHKDMRGVIVVS
jgi:cytochrome c oxidase subunit 2